MSALGAVVDADAEARSGRTWVVVAGRTAVTGHLPAWAEDDPSGSVPLSRLSVVLADISHRVPFDGQRMRVGFANGSDAAEQWVLSGFMRCTPYAEAPAPCVPVVDLLIVDDWWVNDLDPAGLSEVIALLRAQADRLDREVRPALVAARDAWASDPPARLAGGSAPQAIRPT
ncbi:DUF6907 domain-containing protein [Streptomyces sp. CBMA29]|uniref:DUF6907 domain-containing protein n=1 Tax=Streptomyces sp. CBMA29 TaxID=1896314 RepID=UPI001661F940|nr:hypothetical protein [Streptomyces sp. CBMA29]MBD0738187.1 hypothetical protein [Streptomyces sp. CBMA29]